MDGLISTGEEFLDRSKFDRAKLKVWQIRVERMLKLNYDEEVATEFRRILSRGGVVYPGMDFYGEKWLPRIQECISFLQALRATDMPKERPKMTEATRGPLTVQVSGGTVVVGDHNTVNNITVKEVLDILEKEIEAKAPDGEDKIKTLSAIKGITTNETFAAVVGQTRGSFLSHIVK